MFVVYFFIHCRPNKELRGLTDCELLSQFKLWSDFRKSHYLIHVVSLEDFCNNFGTCKHFQGLLGF